MPLTHWVRVPDPDPLGARMRCLTLTHGARGTRPGVRGARAARRRRGGGFEGAGEGRSEVGRWQGGITNPVKIFSKITNPVGNCFYESLTPAGQLSSRCTKSHQAVHSVPLWNKDILIS